MTKIKKKEKQKWYTLEECSEILFEELKAQMESMGPISGNFFADDLDMQSMTFICEPVDKKEKLKK